jgi:hypothetical protein
MEMILALDPRDGAKGNLGANAGVQLATNLDVASGTTNGGLSLADFLTRHSTAV